MARCAVIYYIALQKVLIESRMLPETMMARCAVVYYIALQKVLTESLMLPKTRLAPMPAKPAALPKALEGTRRSLSFFFTSSFCSLIWKAHKSICARLDIS